MSKKKVTISTIISVATLLVLVATAAFAFFSGSVSISNNIGFTANLTGKSYVFTAMPTGSMAMNITADMMSESEVSQSAIATTSASMNISLDSSLDTVTTTCTYDLVWKWTGTDRYPLTGSSSSSEFTYTITPGKSETNFPAANSDGEVTLATGLQITATGSIPATKNHLVTARIYNRNANQNYFKGKNFTSSITVKNINCTVEEFDGEVIGGILVTDGSLTQSVLTQLNNANQLQVLGGMYRYTSNIDRATYGGTKGANTIQEDGVNNFVCLGTNVSPCPNNNLYRIIGVTKDDKYNDGTTDVYSNLDGLVKIIKANSIGNNSEFKYNNSNTQEVADTTKWGSNDLYKRLIGQTSNGGPIYLGTTDYAYLNTLINNGIIVNAKWKIKDIAQNYATYYFPTYNGNAALGLENESKNYETDANASKLSTSDIIETNVGLAYPSDFLYSNIESPTYTATNTNSSSEYAKNLKGWMYSYVYDYNAFEWTMSRYGWLSSSSHVDAWFVYNSGPVRANNVRNSYGARAVLYLSSSAIVSGGDGTLGNPYRVLAN